ncbi:MAG: hypothetical protein K2P70_19510 [Hyphomonadaceae bacterium]|nr:hypothetical protein [Hyphomonadaceae bacterium]
MIPQFDKDTGYLPPGVHSLTWAAFAQRFGWNDWRVRLCAGLLRALRNLKAAGCLVVIVDGSFVSAKDEPGDYDAAFDPTGVDGAKVDPILLRHWDGRKAMKAKYLGETFPWGAIAERRSGVIFLEFFQKDRSGLAKGVVQIDLRTLP